MNQSSQRPPRILVVGSLVMDMITTSTRVPETGATVLGESFSTAPGGKGANQAVQAARLGAEVTMVGKVGRDYFGSCLRCSLQEAGVDTSRLLETELASTAVGNVQLTGADGGETSNRIIVVPGANMALTVPELAFIEDIVADYDMVMLQLEIPMEVNEYVAACARRRGVPVMLNPAPIAPIPEGLLENLSYLSPNETEAEGLLGFCPELRPGESSWPVPEGQLAALSRFRQAGLLVTLGGEGAVMLSGGRVFHSPCVQGVRAVDPTAAGDSFVAAFCTALCRGMDTAEAMKFANYTAAITITRMGAQPSLPTLAQVRALLEARGEALASRLPDAAGEDEDAALARFNSAASGTVSSVLGGLDHGSIAAAARLISDCELAGGRIHISGIGKPGHVAAYIASLMSSTGTPTYFLHGTEAVHGSCGQLRPGDVVIFISNSGETSEMKAAVRAIKDNGCKLIGVTGNADSWLAAESDVHLLAAAENEGGPLNRAPRASILAETVVLQALSVVLQHRRNISPRQYVKWHPGGALGQLRKDEL